MVGDPGALFTETYRPLTFSAVIGQNHVVEELKEHVRGKKRGALLLVGPHGLGKTSLARIAAKSMLCQANEGSPEPCNRCVDCREFDRKVHARCRVLNCGTDGNVLFVKDLVDFLRDRPFGSCGRKVGILDEVHAINKASFDALLQILETPPEWVTLFLMTTEPNKIPGAIRSRCKPFELKPLDSETALDYARRICLAEGWNYEPRAIEVIVEHSRGHVRNLIRDLGRFASSGRVDSAEVCRLYNLSSGQQARAFLYSVVSGAKLSEQKGILDDWNVDLAVKADEIQDLLVSLLLDVEEQTFRMQESSLSILYENRKHILARLLDTAAGTTSSVNALLRESVSLWTFSQSIIRRAVFNERLVRFDSLIRDWEADARVSRLPRRRQGAIAKRASSPGAASSQDNCYLKKADLASIWDASSFLTQVHGVRFNTRLTISYNQLYDSRKSASSITSRLINLLSAALKRWDPRSARAFHWMSLHEQPTGQGPLTHFLAHIPINLHDDARLWVRGSFSKLISDGVQGRAGLRLRMCSCPEPSAQLRFHRFALLSVSRGLDPQVRVRVDSGERRHLIDVLGVPKRLQRASGTIAPMATRRFGLSQTIGISAQNALAEIGPAALVPFHDGEWS